MPGGVGDYTHEIARGLAEQGISVGVLTSQAAGGDSAIHSPAFALYPRIPVWDWSSLGIIQRTRREFAADIVHIQYQTGAFGMRPAINLLPRRLRLSPSPRKGEGRRVRSVTTFHDLLIPYLFPKAGPLREWVTRELARSSDAVISTNERDCRQLEQWRIPSVSLIPIGSNVAVAPPADYDRTAWRARLGVSQNETLLCHFGFVHPSKGLESLLRALRVLAADTSLNKVRLLMIGGQTGANDRVGAEYLSRLQSQIREMGLENRVLWTGYASQEVVAASFLASDLCVLPYREGASFHHGTLMAALAHGMPIVTTRVGPVANRPSTAPDHPSLHDGENCLLVPPDDADALANAIRRAVASPALRAKIADGARPLSLAFGWDRIVERHLELYRRITPHAPS